MTNQTFSSSFSVPESWLGATIAPHPPADSTDVEELITNALCNPIGTPRLRDLARSGQRVAILIDDCTRKTPTAQILPFVLAELSASGVPQHDITIVVALGTHRPLTERELAAKLGAAANAGCAVVNQSCTDSTGFVEVGHMQSLQHGFELPSIPAQLNRLVLDTDLRISIGMITPHLDAGFSGGAKMVLPGVCSLATVDAFHLASAFVSMNQLGDPDAPLRRLLEAFVALHAPLHFIVNVVLRLDGSPHACVAGDPITAHRAGVVHARRVYGVHVDRRYPIVIANCTPYDQDLWQSLKGAWAGDLLTADGGTLILLSAAPEGNSTYPLVPYYAGIDPDLLRTDILSAKVIHAMQAATGVMWGTLRRRIRLSLVSPGLTAEDAAAMRAEYFADVEAATAAAVSRLPASEREGAVAVILQAGVVLPMSG
jgi:nickel-dependent lactate racemase